MGGIISLGTLACCFTSTAASCLCSICPSCKNSTSARIMYALLLLVTTVVCCIFLAPGLQDNLQKLPFCKGGSGEKSDAGGFNINDLVDQAKDLIDSTKNDYQVDCTAVVGYLAVYRYVLTNAYYTNKSFVGILHNKKLIVKLRLCFIVTLFFSLMAIITIGVNNSNDFRAGIQNGMC